VLEKDKNIELLQDWYGRRKEDFYLATKMSKLRRDICFLRHRSIRPPPIGKKKCCPGPKARKRLARLNTLEASTPMVMHSDHREAESEDSE